MLVIAEPHLSQTVMTGGSLLFRTQPVNTSWSTLIDNAAGKTHLEIYNSSASWFKVGTGASLGAIPFTEQGYVAPNSAWVKDGLTLKKVVAVTALSGVVNGDGSLFGTAW